MFSLDNNECYYYKSRYTMCSCSYLLHFTDLNSQQGCLSNSNANTPKNSCDYKGKNYALSGVSSSFQVEDFETYELTLV